MNQCNNACCASSEQARKKTICPKCRHYGSTIYINRYTGEILGCRDCVEIVDVECYLRHVGGVDD